VANTGQADLQFGFYDFKWTFRLMRCVRLLPLLIALFMLGCAGTSEDELANLSANELYSRAKAALDSGDYETAINTFEKLEARFPFGK
jgi:outer membrane protein assembly factor BamD